jgi:hypothetical protein
MEVKQFAVSVQWGKGMHHFQATDLTSLEDANNLAKATIRQKLRMKVDHVKPVVYVWHIESSFKE